MLVVSIRVNGNFETSKNFKILRFFENPKNNGLINDNPNPMKKVLKTLKF